MFMLTQRADAGWAFASHVSGGWKKGPFSDSTTVEARAGPKFRRIRRVDSVVRSMSSASADPFTPRPFGGALHRCVAIVPADAEGREIFRSVHAAISLDDAGTVALPCIDDLASGRPDVVILIADFSAHTGVAALRRIRKDVPETPVVVIARDGTSAIAARRALNAGADAFVHAHEVEHSLAPALDAVMAGLVCAPREARRLVAKPTFSHREKEVLGLLVEGLTNRQIAARLFLAESTVKSHLVSAFAKLGVRSRKDAAALLLDPAEGLAATALPPGGASRRPMLTS
jgi:DNA-binding NarL/FixJ family response regulator